MQTKPNDRTKMPHTIEHRTLVAYELLQSTSALTRRAKAAAQEAVARHNEKQRLLSSLGIEA